MSYYTGQEGYGRFTPAERRQFYRYSRGSLEETNPPFGGQKSDSSSSYS